MSDRFACLEGMNALLERQRIADQIVEYPTPNVLV